ncbi:MAG: endonuclease III [Clostridia bacterium]|nr:endonuclease III [Clostridia bacterium]
MAKQTDKKDIQKMTIDYLNELYPNAECELNFSSAFELLVAVILSAQCTDARVNKVTPVLFKEYGTPQKLASARQEDIERIIYSCGFYHNKAKNLIACSKDIVEKYDGEVPGTLDKLQTLAGVGRKTANVVYSLWFKGDAIAVDTHVFRVSNRLAIATGKTPFEVEDKLMKAYKKADWSKLHYMLVLFGRYKCKAIKPECETCKLREFCKHYKSTLKQI